MSYSEILPSWSVGPECYDDVYDIVRFFGKHAAVIGGETAISKAYALLKENLEGKDFSISDPIVYGKNSTFENVTRLLEIKKVQDADMIFCIGGGRATDTCKVIADKLGKPLFTFPTIASNCAPVTAISVMYHLDGSFDQYYYPKHCPNHSFINTKIIAEAPEELFWAGIGDALSKTCEVELATRGEELFHTTLLGAQIAETCTDPLVQYGAQAMEYVREKKVGYELEQVALDIIVSTGLVSNMTCSETDYYYNSSLAHCVYYGATLVPASGGKHLHGEIVSFGVLTLLTYDKQFEERERLMKFNHSIGLPITLDEIGLKDKDLQTIADKAATVLEWSKAPYTVTKENFMQAMRDADVAGKAYMKAEG
jgi:glycerol dehydrogenase